MKRFFFWSEWPLSQQILYVFGLMLLALGIAYYFISYSLGNANVIHWNIDGDLNTVKVVLDTFQQYLFEFTIEADNYLLTETFQPSLFKLNLASVSPYILLQSIGIIYILTAISDLRKLWFFVGMVSLFLLWAYMGFELHGILTEYHDQAYFTVVCLSFLVPAFIIQHFLPQIPHWARFIGYAGIMATHGWVIHTYSQLPEPFLHISNFGIIVPLLLSIGFIVLTAHEFIRGAVFITTHESISAGKDSSKRFAFLAGLYIANMIYAYLHATQGFDLNILYLEPYPAFALSALLGIWGMKSRENQYKEVMNFASTGALLYIGTALLAIATVTYVLANVNDPFIEVFEDAIIFTHIGFGLGFIGYTYANFYPLLQTGNPVYKVLFRPLQMDYLYGAVLGILVIVGLMFTQNFFTYDQAFAGYNNGLGDAYKAAGDEYTSKQYYNVAVGYSPVNHRSHYTLGSMALAAGDVPAATYFFENANWKNPSPYAYAQLAAIDWADKGYFEAIFKLKKGIEDCPKSGELYNNLALLFNKMDIPDSVFLYFELAKNFSESPEIVESNSFSFWNKYQVFQNIDSIYGSQPPIEYVGTAANELIYLNLLGKPTPRAFNQGFLPEYGLNTAQLCYLFHYAINQRETQDTTLLNTLEAYAKYEGEQSFADYLDQAKAFILLEQGNLQEAIKIFESLGEVAGAYNPYFHHIAGLWCLRADLPEKAAPFFKVAAKRGHPEGNLNLAIALSELADKTAALALWQKLDTVATPEQQELANDMLRILHPDSLSLATVTNSTFPMVDKYRFLHYRRHTITPEAFQQVVSSIEDPNFQAVVIAERLDALLKKGNSTQEIASVYQQLYAINNGLNPQATAVRAKVMLAYQASVKRIDKPFSDLLATAEFDKTEKGELHFYQGNVAEVEERIAEADSLYQKAIQQFPFEPIFYRTHANLYRKIGDMEKTYEKLLEGLRMHPENSILLQDYAMTALTLSYFVYADEAAATLKEVMPSAPYQEFMQAYNTKKADIEKEFEDWNN